MDATTVEKKTVMQIAVADYQSGDEQLGTLIAGLAPLVLDVAAELKSKDGEGISQVIDERIGRSDDETIERYFEHFEKVEPTWAKLLLEHAREFILNPEWTKEQVGAELIEMTKYRGVISVMHGRRIRASEATLIVLATSGEYLRNGECGATPEGKLTIEMADEAIGILNEYRHALPIPFTDQAIDYLQAARAEGISEEAI